MIRGKGFITGHNVVPRAQPWRAKSTPTRARVLERNATPWDGADTVSAVHAVSGLFEELFRAFAGYFSTSHFVTLRVNSLCFRSVVGVGGGLDHL